MHTKTLEIVLSLLVLIGAPCAWVSAQDSTPPFVHSVALDRDDTHDDIIWKAANVVPSPRQLQYYERGYLAFVHFGPNTFSGVEWGSGKEDATIFNPGETMDTDQWCRIFKDAGMKQVIITVKHHDGFCLWQTRYNDTFSVRAIPWRDGNGDVLRDLADSCRKYGLRLGVYLSPADLYQIENENGLYGNLSEYRPTVIPTDPQHFKTEPTRVRADRPAGKPVFEVSADDYNRYFMNQLYELLTEYGPIHEVWFDGAHPKRKGGQTYIKEEWFRMIRELAPDAVIFGGPDVRWVGNESGNTRATEWNILPVDRVAVSGEDRPGAQPGSDQALMLGEYDVYGKSYRSRYLYFLIPEVDTSIRAGWFWRDENRQTVRSPDNVFDIYERSLGGNATFLLNVPPSDKGLIGARDEECLLEVGRRIRATYDQNLIDGAKFTANGKRIKGLTDGDLGTHWMPQSLPDYLEIQLPEVRRVNRFVLQEALADVGQRIAEHRLEAWLDGEWVPVAKATTVGFRRILRFPGVETDHFRLWLTEARLLPTIAEVSAHYYQPPPSAVSTKRLANDTIALSTVPTVTNFGWKGDGKSQDDSVLSEGVIRYTLDGNEPSADAPIYTEPFALPAGGLIKARTFVGDQAGPVMIERIGVSNKGWKIVSVSSQHGSNYSAEKAIDGDPNTFWHTSWSNGHPVHPHNIVIDIGQPIKIGGITYLPRQDRPVPDSRIERGLVEVSADGENWKPAGEFSFGNLVNDPSMRSFWFEQALSGRFVRITSLAGTADKPYAGAAEIGLISSAAD